MKLHNAIHKYLICTLAEGFPKSATSQYHHVLTKFLETVGDMEITTLTHGHVRNFLEDIPSSDRQKLLRHTTILRVFTHWLKAQNQIRPLACLPDLTSKPSRWWLITPRRLAMREKLPLVL